MQALLTKIEDSSIFTIGVNDEFSSLAENITNIERNSETAFNG